MSPVPVDAPALRLALAFVNTYDLLETPPDFLTVERAQRLARRHGAADLARDLAGADLDDLRELRGRLYRVFADRDKVAALRDALAAERAQAALADADGPLRLAVVTDNPHPVRRLAALLLDALVQAMVAGGPDRFGTCAGHPCRCAYVDRSRAGRQRFCCQLCNDRIAAAAYRSRSRSHVDGDHQG
jgi:predicted RNA-binding Zn ribbon-like protein